MTQMNRLLGPQREIDRLTFSFDQQEDRLILGKAGSGLFIGLQRGHRLAIDFEYKIAFTYTHFLRRASGFDPDHYHATIGGLQSVPSSQFLVELADINIREDSCRRRRLPALLCAGLS